MGQQQEGHSLADVCGHNMTFSPDQAIAVPDDSDPSVPPSATAVHRFDISQFPHHIMVRRSDPKELTSHPIDWGPHQDDHILPATRAHCYTKIMPHCALEERIRTFVRFGTMVAEHD